MKLTGIIYGVYSHMAIEINGKLKILTFILRMPTIVGAKIKSAQRMPTIVVPHPTAAAVSFKI
jgi:hypothetical protein